MKKFAIIQTGMDEYLLRFISPAMITNLPYELSDAIGYNVDTNTYNIKPVGNELTHLKVFTLKGVNGLGLALREEGPDPKPITRKAIQFRDFLGVIATSVHDMEPEEGDMYSSAILMGKEKDGQLLYNLQELGVEMLYMSPDQQPNMLTSGLSLTAWSREAALHTDIVRLLGKSNIRAKTRNNYISGVVLLFNRTEVMQFVYRVQAIVLGDRHAKGAIKINADLKIKVIVKQAEFYYFLQAIEILCIEFGIVPITHIVVEFHKLEVEEYKEHHFFLSQFLKEFTLEAAYIAGTMQFDIEPMFKFHGSKLCPRLYIDYGMYSIWKNFFKLLENLSLIEGIHNNKYDEYVFKEYAKTDSRSSLLIIFPKQNGSKELRIAGRKIYQLKKAIWENITVDQKSMTISLRKDSNMILKLEANADNIR